MRGVLVVLLCFLPSIVAMLLSAWMVHTGHPWWGAFWALFALVTTNSVEVSRR